MSFSKGSDFNFLKDGGLFNNLKEIIKRIEEERK